MSKFEMKKQDRCLAEAKEGPGTNRTASFFALKRFNPLALLDQTSLPCLKRIAENTSIPPTMLEQLALHEDAAIREAVADNSNTPVDTLWVLAGDACDDVRYAMAENHNLPIAILTALACDDNPYVMSRAEMTLRRLAGAHIVSGNFHARGGGKAVLKMG
jgi:hypothetical protein